MANILKRLRCLVGRHSLARRKVHYDGDVKTGPCAYCGIELEKRTDGRWLPRRTSRNED